MIGDDFYLTLMSNSSFQDYPENKTSSFTVKLPKTISLEGSYEVALCELTFPMTIENVTKDNNQLIIELMAVDENNQPTLTKSIIPIHYRIEEGYYRSLDEILDALNRSIIYHTPDLDEWTEKKIDFLVWDTTRQQIILNSANLHTVLEKLKPIAIRKRVGTKDNCRGYIFNKIYLEGLLALQLGYEPGEDMVDLPFHHKPHINFGISDTFMVYCDVVEPQIVSNIYGQVLKVVQSIDSGSHFGDLCYRSYIDRSYLPVVKNYFDTISIDIRQTTVGRLVPFSFGNVYVLVHFKKVQK